MTNLDKAIAHRGVRDIATIVSAVMGVVGLGLAMSADRSAPLGGDLNQLIGGVVLIGIALFVLGWISYRGYLAKRETAATR